MSQKVDDFFETFRVPCEGMDLGDASDKLPPSLVTMMEKWLAKWDPRRLRPTALWAPSLVVEMSVEVFEEDRAYYRMEAFMARAERVRRFWTQWELLPFSFKPLL